MKNVKTAKNAIGESLPPNRAFGRPPNSSFADTAIGSGALPVELRKVRNEWLASNKAREQQLAEIAGGGLTSAYEHDGRDAGAAMRAAGEL